MSLVGNKSGRRVVLWGALLRMMLWIVPSAALLPAVVYLAITGNWKWAAAGYGAAGGGGTVLILLIANFVTPLTRLPFVR